MHRTNWAQRRVEGKRGGSDLIALGIEAIDSDGTFGGRGGGCLADAEDAAKGEETGAKGLVLRSLRRECWFASRPCGTDTAVWRFGLETADLDSASGSEGPVLVVESFVVGYGDRDEGVLYFFVLFGERQLKGVERR